MKEAVSNICSVIWSPALVVLLVAAGIYFSFGTRFVQVRRIGLMVRNLFPKEDRKRNREAGISSFEAFCIALSGRVGTGNIIGVATALGIGGPGAIFWMWVVAFFGASTAFVESTLAQIFKDKHDGHWFGGPALYIAKGLKCRWLAVLFAVVTVVGVGVLCTTVQANGVASSMYTAFGVKTLYGGIALAVLIALVVFGGVKRISKVATVVTPFMAIGYIVVALAVLAVNWRAIPAALGCIFSSAFGINPVCGGIIGMAVEMGVKRGLFSNEAGQGTGAIPSAAADVPHPARQGLAQGFSVYIDTLFICTATALMLIVTGCYNIVDPQSGRMLLENNAELGGNYAAFTQAAIDSVFGGFGSAFVCIALVFFAFTTLMAYYFYSESSLIYLFRNSRGPALKVALSCFKTFFIAAIIFGALKEANAIWQLADIGIGMMAWINVIVILILSPKAFRSLREFESSNK